MKNIIMISREKSYEVERSHSRSESPVAGGSGAGGGESLSVDETNRLRAKLGLKPLQVSEKPAGKCSRN